MQQAQGASPCRGYACSLPTSQPEPPAPFSQNASEPRRFEQALRVEARGILTESLVSIGKKRRKKKRTTEEQAVNPHGRRSGKRHTHALRHKVKKENVLSSAFPSAQLELWISIKVPHTFAVYACAKMGVRTLCMFNTWIQIVCWWRPCPCLLSLCSLNCVHAQAWTNDMHAHCTCVESQISVQVLHGKRKNNHQKPSLPISRCLFSAEDKLKTLFWFPVSGL